MDDIQNILNKINNNEDISSEEITKFIEFIGNNPDTMSSEDLNRGFSDLMSDPRFVEHAKKAAKKQKKNEALQAGVGVINSIVDLGISRDQIKRSDNALGKISKPVAPRPPRRNPLLSQQIANAQRDKLNIGAQLAPSRLDILDQYLKDIGTAKTASTGQASTFGSLAQVAANRRNRANASLAPAAARIRNMTDSRLDSLLGQRISEDQMGYRNNLGLYDRALNEYNRDINAAGNLGATGRSNMRQSLGGLLNSLPAITGGMSNINLRQPEANIGVSSVPTQGSLGFGPEIDDYNSRVNQNLQRRFNPYNQSQFYYTN